jgi:small subunit ribosomal protein S4
MGSRTSISVCKLCRREKEKLYLKGERCDTVKCSLTRRAYAPGQHGQNMRRKTSEYGLRLREKQKARRFYGVSESQFSSMFKQASTKHGVTGEIFLQMLEQRLDNVVYRIKLASSRREGRVMVRHQHIEVNGIQVDIPSFQVKAGDVISVKEKSGKLFKESIDKIVDGSIVSWLSFNKENSTFTVVELPNREQIDAPVNDQLIVEYYSK